MDLNELPLPLALDLAERLAADPGRVSRLAGGRVLLDQSRLFAQQLVRLFGPVAGVTGTSGLAQQRLAFLLVRPLLDQALSGDDPAGAPFLASRTEIRGREHLERSVTGTRGTVLVSTHFGFPILARLALAGLDVPVLVAAAHREGEQLASLEGDLWSSVRVLRHILAALGNHAVCVFLADGMTGGARVRVPFFRRKAHIGLGAFHVARLAGCPVVPFFALAPKNPRRFQLTFLPPLRSGGRGRTSMAVAREFVALYRPYAREYPSHLPHRALFQD